jgi:hypothetical protein
MAARILTVTILTCGIAFCAIGMANARPVSTISPVAVPHAPEIDPTALGSGIAMLFGGMMLLGERRCGRK